MLATYTSLNVKAFSKNDLATFKFSAKISNEEKVFLVLALLFHDLQLPPVAEHRVCVMTTVVPATTLIYIYLKQTFGQKAADTGKAAGGIAAENLATSVATTAVTNCCAVM